MARIPNNFHLKSRMLLNMDALISTAVEVRDIMSTYIPQKITGQLLIHTLIPVTPCL